MATTTVPSTLKSASYSGNFTSEVFEPDISAGKLELELTRDAHDYKAVLEISYLGKYRVGTSISLFTKLTSSNVNSTLRFIVDHPLSASNSQGTGHLVPTELKVDNSTAVEPKAQHILWQFDVESAKALFDDNSPRLASVFPQTLEGTFNSDEPMDYGRFAISLTAPTASVAVAE